MELPGFSEPLLDEQRSRDSSTSYRVVDDLDAFFTNMYKYYYNNGLLSIMLGKLCDIICLAFTIGLSFLLLGFLDWHSLMQCHDESSCKAFSYYILSNPFHHSSALGVCLMMYILICISYWGWQCFMAFREVVGAFEMHSFYREKLGFNDLRGVMWNSVLERLIYLHENRIYRVVMQEKLTEHDIVSRIMRKENYMIAFVNKKLLNLRAPWWLTPFVGSEALAFTKSLEWSLQFCILDHLFTSQSYTISGSFLRDRNGLGQRFFTVGVVHFLLLPFMLIFMVISFFLNNAQQFHSSRSYFGPRQWSPLAMWMFREFNELPHLFEERINRSVTPTNEYLDLLRSPYVAILGNCIAYIAGAIVAVLVAMSFADDGILLYVNVLDHNLLWFLGIFTAIYAGGKSLASAATSTYDSKILNPHEFSMEAEGLLRKIGAFTHYFPQQWSGKAHSALVFGELTDLFPYKVQIFGMELYSVIITPIILCFSLPNCVDDLISFIKEHTEYVDGVGSVVDYASFNNFSKYGDDKYGAMKGEMEDKHKAREGKMEKSLMNFHKNYPMWQSTNRYSAAVINNVENYKNERMREKEQGLINVLQQSMVMSTKLRNSKFLRRQGSDDHLEELRSQSDESDPSIDLHVHNDFPQTESIYAKNVTVCPQAESSDLSGAKKQMDSSYSLNERLTSSVSSGLLDESQGLPIPVAYSSNLASSSQMNNILRSVLRQENIDYENEFYWMDMLQKDTVKVTGSRSMYRSMNPSGSARVNFGFSGVKSPARSFYRAKTSGLQNIPEGQTVWQSSTAKSNTNNGRSTREAHMAFVPPASEDIDVILEEHEGDQSPNLLAPTNSSSLSNEIDEDMRSLFQFQAPSSFQETDNDDNSNAL